jgi:hypothetical protein
MATAATSRRPELPAASGRPEKHSLTLRGHRTSVSLEPEFWGPSAPSPPARAGRSTSSPQRSTRPAAPSAASRPPSGSTSSPGAANALPETDRQRRVIPTAMRFLIRPPDDPFATPRLIGRDGGASLRGFVRRQIRARLTALGQARFRARPVRRARIATRLCCPTPLGLRAYALQPTNRGEAMPRPSRFGASLPPEPFSRRPYDSCRGVTEKRQAGFQPISSRFPAAGNEAFSGTCLAIANPRDFAPFHPVRHRGRRYQRMKSNSV